MRAPLSLRGKLLLSFCGVVVFACFLSLFWGFSQYRNLIGEFVDRQARVGLTWLAGEVRAGVNEADGPTVSRVGEILAGLVDRPLLDNAVVLYAPPDGPVRSFGGPAGLIPNVSVQRQDVALTLKLTPHINNSDFVRLELDQQIQDIASENFNNLGPSWSNRALKTTVVVKDQETVVIGGLIQDNITQTETKVPLLGDIPILGYLFKSTRKTKTKTNLLVVLTPYIIKDQTDLQRIVERKMRERREFVETFTTFEVMGVFSGSKEEVAAIGEAVGLAGDAVSGLGLPEGTFDLAISTDDGKINVNCANTNNVAEQAILQTKLQALVYSDAYEQLFQNESADGWRRSRDEQVAAIIDYVDRDTNRYTGPDASGRAPEDYGYQQNDDRYLAKNNYIDTVDELKLVRGIDDRFWTLFGSAFTVYGDCKQNIGAVQDVNVILAIIVAAAKDGDPVAQDINRVWLLAQFVAKARQMGFLFDDLNSFADFVKDPGAMRRFGWLPVDD